MTFFYQNAFCCSTYRRFGRDSCKIHVYEGTDLCGHCSSNSPTVYGSVHCISHRTNRNGFCFQRVLCEQNRKKDRKICQTLNSNGRKWNFRSFDEFNLPAHIPTTQKYNRELPKFVSFINFTCAHKHTYKTEHGKKLCWQRRQGKRFWTNKSQRNFYCRHISIRNSSCAFCTASPLFHSFCRQKIWAIFRFFCCSRKMNEIHSERMATATATTCWQNWFRHRNLIAKWFHCDACIFFLLFVNESRAC